LPQEPLPPPSDYVNPKYSFTFVFGDSSATNKEAEAEAKGADDNSDSAEAKEKNAEAEAEAEAEAQTDGGDKDKALLEKERNRYDLLEDVLPLVQLWQMSFEALQHVERLPALADLPGTA
jgi:hypothetical protein